MSKQNKWAGNYGKVASGGSKAMGDNTDSAPTAGSAPRDNSSVKDNIITDKFKLGDDRDTMDVSSHNDINAFTRGIKSRGPYGGPTFASLNNTKMDYQKKDTSSISKFDLPSGRGAAKGTKGGSGYSL